MRLFLLYTARMPPMRNTPDSEPSLPADFIEDAKFIASRQAQERVMGGRLDIDVRTERILACVPKLAGWRSLGVPMSAHVDTRGLKLDLGLEGKKAGTGIHTHVPLSYLQETHVDVISHIEGLMTPKDTIELRRLV